MLGIYLHNIFSKLRIFFSILYKFMHVLMHGQMQLKEGVWKMGNMAERSKSKNKEKMSK